MSEEKDFETKFNELQIERLELAKQKEMLCVAYEEREAQYQEVRTERDDLNNDMWRKHLEQGEERSIASCKRMWDALERCERVLIQLENELQTQTTTEK